MHRHHANAYKSSCEALKRDPKPGGGPGCEGIQAGFAVSRERRSLTQVGFEEFEMVLRPFERGSEEMIEKVREMDEAEEAEEVPIGRQYGRKVQGDEVAAAEFPPPHLWGCHGERQGSGGAGGTGDTVRFPEEKSGVWCVVSLMVSHVEGPVGWVVVSIRGELGFLGFEK